MGSRLAAYVPREWRDLLLACVLQVKMRDVLSLVNSILCANSLAVALSEGVPGVLQQHLDAMQQEVMQQLAPTAQGAAAPTAPVQGQVRALPGGRGYCAACVAAEVVVGHGSLAEAVLAFIFFKSIGLVLASDKFRVGLHAAHQVWGGPFLSIIARPIWIHSIALICLHN